MLKSKLVLISTNVSRHLKN